MNSLDAAVPTAKWCAQVSVGTAESRVRERVRVALEEAVRTHVSKTVTVDADGRVQLTDPLTAALASVHGHTLASWTFATEDREHVNPDEVEYATGVLVLAWAASQGGTAAQARTHPSPQPADGVAD